MASAAKSGFDHFRSLLQRAASGPPIRFAVAGALDEHVLEAGKEAQDELGALLLLAGPGEELAEAAGKYGLDGGRTSIASAADPGEAARAAVAAVRAGEADVLVKGMVPTALFMKAVLDQETGVRGRGLLSHVAVFDIPGFPRMLFITDGGINIAPGLSEKAAILRNAIAVAEALLSREPKAAVLAAVEVVNPDMPTTVDAAALAKMAERGQIAGAVVDGPLALDGAVSREDAAYKGIHSSVRGDADILLVPSVEVGNVLSKGITYFAGGVMAGVVVGGLAPIVLTSRADSAESKLASMCVASIFAVRTRESGGG